LTVGEGIAGFSLSLTLSVASPLPVTSSLVTSSCSSLVVSLMDL
jgi:hypothetical protein